MAEKTVHIKFAEGIYRIIVPGYSKISGFANGTLVGLGKPMIDVIVGEKCAAVIDTGYGEVDLRGYIEKNITDKPLICLNTHGHFDHVGGDAQFDVTYISEKDLEMAKNSLPILEANMDPAVKAAGEPNFVAIRGGEIFDLGGRKLRAIPIPGHTMGSMGFIDSKSKILYSGDAILKRIIVNEVDKETYKQNLLQLKKEDFYEIYGGHWIWPMGRDQVDRFIQLIDTKTKDDIAMLTNRFPSGIVESNMVYFGKDFYDPEFAAIAFSDPDKFFSA